MKSSKYHVKRTQYSLKSSKLHYLYCGILKIETNSINIYHNSHMESMLISSLFIEFTQFSPSLVGL